MHFTSSNEISSSNTSHSSERSGEVSEDAFEYSRQYQQKIRVLGHSSKESWIKRIWNHMFGANKEEWMSESSNRVNVEKHSESIANNTTSTIRMPSIVQTAPKEVYSRDGEYQLQGILQNGDESSLHSAQNDFISESHLQTSRDGCASISAATLRPFSRREYSLPSIQGHQDISAQSSIGTAFPSPVKQKGLDYKLPNVRGAASDTSANKELIATFSKLSSQPGILKSNTVISLSCEIVPGTNNGITNGIVRKQTHQNLTIHQDNWRPKVTRDFSLIQLEKRAKITSDMAIKASKIFTCFAPYPVDAFVRYSLRKRGWVEKFGPRATSTGSTIITECKLQCSTDEDYEIICDQAIPKPWEEDHGIYTIMSRYVSRYPAKFIWGNRSVNNLVLKNDVVVNHFPKAKYFSSKVLLATSLRELPWQNNSTSLAFFPRCYLLNDDDRLDFIEDFQLSACMTLLKLALNMNTMKQSSTKEENALSSNSCESKEDAQLNKSKEKAPSLISHCEPTCILQSDTSTLSSSQNPHELSKISSNHCTDSSVRQSQLSNRQDMNSIVVNEKIVDNEEEAVADIDDVTNEVLYSKFGSQKVAPDLDAFTRERKGGTVPAKAIDWAMQHCDNFIKCKHHEDIDKANKNMSASQWEIFLTWFYAASQDGATVCLPQAKLTECKSMLSKMREVWPQSDIDGLRNIWIVKPGDKSKGIGISLCDNLEDILKYIHDPATQDYIVQKYIERPLLIYKCKFDVRQWFLVTEWMPLTVWFYKISYLRICSQEFNYNSMHEYVLIL